MLGASVLPLLLAILLAYPRGMPSYRYEDRTISSSTILSSGARRVVSEGSIMTSLLIVSWDPSRTRAQDAARKRFPAYSQVFNPNYLRLLHSGFLTEVTPNFSIYRVRSPLFIGYRQ